MSLTNPNNIVRNPNWYGSQETSGTGEPDDLVGNANQVFVINDVVLEIPPTAISIQNEDLTWQWKTLRTRSSTKIASGRGMCQVTLTVVFTPSLLLHLHRLIVQFKHSPFCWVRNRFLRESLAPHWPVFKQIAFTMTGLHIASLEGHPGSFSVQIDLRWFNYAPYGPNFLFRREWRTRPIADTDEQDIEQTIPRFVSVGTGENVELEEQALEFVVDKTPSPLSKWSPVTYNREIHAGYTLQQLKETHMGEVFDLLPLPTRMKRSDAVQDPAQSNIYVRYINSLQQKSLLEHFGVDVHGSLRDATLGVEVGHEDHPWERVTVGDKGGRGLVRGLHSGAVPYEIRERWIKAMLAYSKVTKFTYEDYLSLDVGREIQQKLLDYYRDMSKDARSKAKAKAGTYAALKDGVVTSANYDWDQFSDYLESEGNELVTQYGTGLSKRGTNWSPEQLRDSLVSRQLGAHERIKNAHIIANVAQSRGLTPAWAAAMIVNALHESDLDHRIGGDRDPNTGQFTSYGLFQMHHAYSGQEGARHEHGDAFSVTERTNPVISTNAMITEAFSLVGKPDPVSPGKYGNVPEPPSNAAALAAWWCQWVERPARRDPHELPAARANALRTIFPKGVPKDWPAPIEYEGNYVETDEFEEEEEFSSYAPWEIDEPPSEIEEELRLITSEDGVPLLSEEEVQKYKDIFEHLIKEGFTIYEGDSSVTNVYRRVKEIALFNENWDEDFDPLGVEETGLFIQHDTVVTAVSGSLAHIVASIPIIGHEYPTHQHLGSIEPNYSFEFTSVDASLDGLSVTAQLLQGVRNDLQENARKVRVVPDSSCLCVNSFITRLLGSYKNTDVLLNTESDAIDLVKRSMISRSATQTIEGSPGTSIIRWDVQETNPYPEEFLTPSNEFGEPEDPEARRRAAIQALEKVGTSEHMDNYSTKQLLLGLGESVTGVDALKTALGGIYDSGAAKYFESIESEDKFRTFVIYRASIELGDYHSSAMFTPEELIDANAQHSLVAPTPQFKKRPAAGVPYDIENDREVVLTEANSYERYSAFAEKNGILTRGLESDGSIGLNLTDIVELARVSFESSVYSGTEVLNLDGLNFGYSPPDKRRDEVKYYVVETTKFEKLLPSLETENKIKNFSRMLFYIKVTADLILAEEEINSLDYTGGFSMAYPGSEIRKELYDLDINPSMWGGYLFSLFSNLEFQYQTHRRFGDEYVDYVREYPFLKIQVANPRIFKWLNTHVVGHGVGNFLDAHIVDLPFFLASDIYRNTGIASLGQNLFGDSRYDLNEASMNHHIEVLSAEVSDASYQYSRYAFPLLGGIWTQNLVEKYFGGMRDKLGVQYMDYEGIGDISTEYTGMSLAEGKFGLENFLGGFDDWYASSAWGMRATNNDPSWNPIVTKTQAKRYREYVFAKLAKDAGIPLQNADRVLTADEKTPMFLWDSGDVTPSENLKNLPLFTNLTVEKTKIIHIKGLLQGLADLILGDIEVLEHLGVEYEPPGVGDISSISSGASCYPDLDLPSHPYYGNSLYAMNPDFYYWNIYDDATGTQQRDILERAEAAVMKAVEGPYNMLKSMQRDGLDSSEYADVYGYMDVGNDSLVPAITKLVSQHEASDEVEARWYPPGDGEGVLGAPVWIGTGETHQNIAAVNMFTKEGKISPEYTAYLDRGKAGFEALQAEVNKIKDIKTKERAQKDLDKLKAYQERQQVFPPLLSNWHGNPLYQPTGEELEYYTELSKKIVNTESFFGSRLGYVGGLQDPDDDSSEGLNDTKLAALAEYKMVFDPESLKRLAIDSSKDILSQKYTMKRAFPTFKLYFVEEDEIYNRILAFDDFHAYNGVKEFTVHQSRKNPADTATIVLQNVSGTLDGTKRSVITDLDYYKVDESGNYKNPSEKLTANTIANNSATDENGIITSADKPLPTRPAWVDNKSQPFGAVILRPGLNVQLRAGYSNDPNMLNVLISGRVVDVQWSTNGDLVEIVVQSFGTELVKYLKGRGNSYGAGGESDSDPEVYPTTHQLLSSLMLSPELKHFGRWTRSGIFQPGESKDASIDFFDYAGTSYFKNFKTTNSLASWMFQHPIAVTAISGLGYLALATPVGKGVTAPIRGLLGRAGSWLSATRVGAAVGGAASKVRGLAPRISIPGSKFVSGRVHLLNPARSVIGSRGRLGVTKKFIDEATRGTANVAGALGNAKRAIENTGAFNGFIGGFLRKQYQERSDILVKAIAAGDDAAISAASKALIRSEQTALYTHATLLQIGIGSTTANVTKLTMWTGAGRVALNLASVAAYPWVKTGKLTTGVLAAGLLLELPARSLADWAYSSTIGQLSRDYALTKSKLYLSPQDDNLYPPSPKDYMRFDYIALTDDPVGFTKNTGKKLVFGTAKQLLYRIGVAERGGMWAEDEALSDWYSAWTYGSKPTPLLEKRVDAVQCEYYCDNVTIWDVFHEMSLRHPGWVYGARPYGTKFRYTMFFGVPSQRYWAKPASNNFIHRMTRLRKYAGIQVTEESYKLLYGSDSLDSLKRDIENKVVTIAKQRNYGHMGEQEELLYPDAPEMQMSFGEAIASNYVHKDSYNEHLRLEMTNRVLEEYLLGLQNRFLPFRRYHYITSDADIVHNGIISSNRGVVNAVSVLYNTPDSNPESPYPGGVVDMKASARIPEDEINMAPVQYSNCRGYTMGLRYGLGTLLHTMREMYKGELLVLGNPRIRPWDICIVRDEYNDMVGPVEVEAVVHMFSHETGYLTEIKPNAVVMANEISSMPVLNALQLMCMAVQDNANGKASIDTELSYSESDAFSAAAVMLSQHRPPKLEPTRAWKQDMVAEYKSVFSEDGFSLEEMFPNWSDTEMQRITRGIQDPKELKDSLTSGIGLAGLGVGIASGATAFLASKGYYPKNKWGAIAALALLGTSTGAALGLNGVINSVNLSWFIAAPILFAKCMEEETVTIMPLTKNGIPIVSGLTARDPSMLWRSIFNKYYNYAQDTAIGLQDMAWFWNMAGDSWWDKWVEYNEGYADYRRDFAEAAGGG